MAVAMGAVGGAIGAGFTAIGGTLANSFGYNIVAQVGSSAATSAIFGQELTWGSIGLSIAGSIAGATAALKMPQYNAIQGAGWLKNFGAEVGINAARGAVSGFATGATMAIIDKDANHMWKQAMGGAVNGVNTTLATNILFGNGFYYDDSAKFGNEGNKPVYRSGGLIGLGYKIYNLFLPANIQAGGGINWGRTAYFSDIEDTRYLDHEGTHWRQQQQDGFARFYGKTVSNYAKSIWQYGSLQPLYYTPNSPSLYPGNYEDIAGQIQFGTMKWSW